MNQYDVIVVGGGFAGVAAALSAARADLQVLIIEQANCFGGAAANCLVLPFMRNTTKINGVTKQLSGGIFNEIICELAQLDKIKSARCFHEEYLKLVLNRMILKQNIDVLFHSTLIGAKANEGKVDAIQVANKSGIQEYRAAYFIDATGDADLAAMAGFPFRLGRDEDQLCQPMTLSFRVANVDIDTYFEEKKSINELYDTYRNQGKIKNPRENVLVFDTLMDGVLHFNTTRVIKYNPIDAMDLTKAEMEAREQVFEMMDFLKTNFKAFKDSEVISTAASIGVRESRMIIGEHVLTGEEIKACTVFEDSIAVGNYDLDIHNPEGTGTSHYYFPPGEYYQIPYRSLVPKDSVNMLVAGRCISTDHHAQASIRIMPIVCCLGEACGTAIGIAAKTMADVQNIDRLQLQDTLVKNGAIID